MGQSKGGGYTQKSNYLPSQTNLVNQVAQNSPQYTNQAAQGFQSFLPGGSGNNPIIDAAMKNYQQKTLPSILNAYGSDSKGGSAINQALGASAADLNTNLGAIMAQNQLTASQGLGNLGLGGQGQALSAQPFSHLQNQPPMWQQLLSALLSGAGGAAKGFGGF